MFEYYFCGVGLRLGQTIIYASLWIVIGLVISAVFRCMLGPEKVRKLFGDGTRYGILSGWLIGMLLPVCSLGVIPIVRELHRCGVKGGTIIAFALTAPLFNPMSVLYGLTLSDPIAILSFSLCALVIVSILGTVWNRFFVDETAPEVSNELPEPGIKRVSALGYTMAKELVGISGLFIIIGICGSVLMAVICQKGYLQTGLEHDDWMAPITVAGITLPIYSTPLLAMSQIGGMFQHGNSIGAAFSLLILGAGANLGVVAWFIYSFGWKKTLVFLSLLAATTISLAYAIDKPLYPKGVVPKGHSHAFDVYSHPYSYGQSGLFKTTSDRLGDFWVANELGGTPMIVLLLVAATILKGFDGQRIEAWFFSKTDRKKGGVDIVLPDWTIGATAVAGLVTASVVGAYLFYPPSDEVMRQIYEINTDVILDSRTEKWESAEKWIGFADDLSRRLEVGVFLREGSVDEFKSAKAKTYRDKLDILKHAVEEQDSRNIKKLADDVNNAYVRLRDAFSDTEE